MPLSIGYKHNEEAKRKMSIAHKGKKRLPFSEEHKKKIGLSNKGKKRTTEERKKMSEIHKRMGTKPNYSWLGKKFSEEHKEKIRQCNIKTYKNGRRSYWLGKKFSERHKEKISIASKGKLKSIQAKINMKGKKISEKHKKILSEIHKGEKNSQWKGGITPISDKIRRSIEYKLFRDSVLARDGYICQKTGIKEMDLEVHHILNFAQCPELRFAIDNGITLSKEMHKEFHRRYGKKKNTKEQLEEFLNNKLYA